jgi:hypothetical protein
MDERTLFDQFHEALDVEPRPGAYERMRYAMTNHPAAVKSQPAFRIRWSKMGLRVAAVLAAAVIAIALGAAILAVHFRPVGSVPAGQDPNVKAYQDMILSDYNAIDAAMKAPNPACNPSEQTPCEAATKTVILAHQKWVRDLNSFRTTPTRFAVIDGQLRRHLNAAITDLNTALALQKAKNLNGYNLAYDAEGYERAWTGPTVFTITGSYPRVAGSYHDALSLARQSLLACSGGGQPGPGDLACRRLYQHCVGADDRTCKGFVETSDAQIQTFLIGLVQNPAPSALAAKDRQVQADLAQVDTYLLAITDALLSGDSAKAGSAEIAYAAAIVVAGADIIAIIGTV